MKIRTKLLLGISPLILILFVVLFFGKIESDSINQISAEIKDDGVIFVLAHDIQKGTQDRAVALRDILIHEEEQQIQEEIQIIENLNKEAAENLELLTSYAETDEHHLIIGEIKAALQQVQDREEEVLSAISSGDLAEANRLVLNRMHPLERDLQLAIEGLVDRIELSMIETVTSAGDSFKKGMYIESVVTALLIILLIIVLFRVILKITGRLNDVTDVMVGIADGRFNLTTKVKAIGEDEIDVVAKSFNKLTHSLHEKRKLEREDLWQKSHVGELSSKISGAKSYETLGETFLETLLPVLGGSHALFYVMEEIDNQKQLRLYATYAANLDDTPEEIRIGEGLVGQCAKEKRFIVQTNIPADYFSIHSGFGRTQPDTLYFLPVLFEDEVRAVIEIATTSELSDKKVDLLKNSVSRLGILLDNIANHKKQALLLEELQMLMGKVKNQSVALNQKNEELKQLNNELEKNSKHLEEQNRLYEVKNIELEEAKDELEIKAQELSRSNVYKTQFLANTSHELRTPLNSMLILSNVLAENKEETLTEQQVDYARTIHQSGKNLLDLINDLLDLSKIEAGRMELYVTSVSIQEWVRSIKSNFQPLADEKKLAFEIKIAEDVPDTIRTDVGKLSRIVKNLLSNAVKFTNKGKVTLELYTKKQDNQVSNLHFAVTDTGIGVKKENLEIIFQAFQQEDGSITRKFGGTGLGLSISKQLAEMLGGEIMLTSEVGIGSTFTFILEDIDLGMKDRRQEVESEYQANSNHDIITSTYDILNRQQQLNLEKYYGKKVLLVDDDIRNIYSVSSQLEDKEMEVLFAENETEAFEILKNDESIALVLIKENFLFSEIDVIEVIESIRGKDIPIITLPANAE